jgi:nucleoside-diphosphate-sugar epimerase
MKIIITGSNGFLGKCLTKKLSNNHSLFHINRTKVLQINSHSIELDLSDEESVTQYLRNNKIPKADIMLNLAASTANKDNTNDLSLLFENSTIASSVAKISKAACVRKLINISSMSIYPNIDGTFNELDLPDPSVNTDCLYGLSKFNGEVLFNFFLFKYVPIISHLRLSMLDGADLRSDRLAKVMMREMETNNTITIFGNGNRLLNIIDIDKAAEYIYYFIKNDLGGIYNLGDECITIQEFANRISRNEDVKIINTDFGNNKKFTLDISKLQNILNKKKNNEM